MLVCSVKYGYDLDLELKQLELYDQRRVVPSPLVWGASEKNSLFFLKLHSDADLKVSNTLTVRLASSVGAKFSARGIE